MKKIYLILIIFVMGFRLAYAQDTTSLAGKMQFIFAQLNRSAISTGFLEERAFPLVSLTPFNGTLTDSNKVQLNTLRATYFTHYTACMLNTNPLLPIDSLNNRINQYLPLADTIPIAIHFGELNAFKSYAVANNLLSIAGDDVLHDVPGRLENPYLLKYLFAATPLKDGFSTGNFALVFKPNLFFTNSSLTVSALYIDFDDGNGYQSTSWNTPLTPNYTTAGVKNIKLKMVMSNSSQYECYAPITVADIPALSRYLPETVNLIKDFDETSNHSGGRVFVRLSSTNNTNHLKKPLIVLEGYDAAQIAPNLTQGGNYSYNHFIDKIDDETVPYDFNYQLDEEGEYDLVFIDYAKGTDDIVRNANLFKAVLNWVNADKVLSGAPQQNVVMGISMGGLVARYGLAQMTKNNETTDTRLLITHDSPHQGANVPVGLQKVVQALGDAEMFGRRITDVFPQYNEAIALFNETASAQMLTYRSSSANGAIQNNTWLSATYRPMITFLPSDPQPTYRFIATSQGSECGTQLFPPSSQLLDVQGNGGAAMIIIPGLNGNVEAKIKANALPALGGSIELSKVKLEAKIKYFFVRIKKETFNHSYTLNSSAYLPIDGASGGTSPIGAMGIAPQSMGGIIGFFLGAYKLNLNTASVSNFAFVPTPSALDVQTYDTPSLSSTYIGGWHLTNPSRAATFIAQESFGDTSNESHTRFTARNAEWLFNEMENISNTLNCSASCIPINIPSISGPSYICDNGTATYTISGVPTGATVIWDPPMVEVISSTASQVTVRLNNGDYEPGAYKIRATVATPCGDILVESSPVIMDQPVYLVEADFDCNDGPAPYQNFCGNPDEHSIYDNIFNYYLSQTPVVPTTLNYRVILGSTVTHQGQVPITAASGSFMAPADLQVGFNKFEIWFTASGSPCNTVGVMSGAWVEVSDCSYYSRMIIYPNPSSTELKVSYIEEKMGANKSNSKSLPIRDFSVKLLNQKGKVLKEGKTTATTKNITLQVADIPNGIYYLHIYEGKKVSKQQVVIAH
ncbi:T9SS type A sorting domain-containing protein [Pedobacter sp. UBA4863]|uniref:T9SS type A sorting domain-containing protein n=1 Tax=Pedobacter sp. UBA4863 TaxID=1947060 RepID=UPI0025F872C9|nr:T9SS type A sorting domain-containing protein [Pedobacter sp. UBA4863]